MAAVLHDARGGVQLQASHVKEVIDTEMQRPILETDDQHICEAADILSGGTEQRIEGRTGAEDLTPGACREP